MPNLRALVERHSKDRFALLGINTGDDEKAFHEGVDEFDVTWTCVWQGKKGSPISDLFQVVGYPTIYVLDAKGRIRFMHLQGESLAQAVQKLLDEIE